MPVESATHVGALNVNNPLTGDPVSSGDDHLRLIKTCLVNSFGGVTGAVTATHTELNILDGATVTTAELNILDGVTSTAAELNILDGVTATTAELNYVDGVTSNIQTQLDSKIGVSSLLGSWTLIKTSPTGTGATFEYIHGSGGVVIDSTYDVYLIELVAVKPSADGAGLLLRTTTDATNFDVVATDYQNSLVQVFAGTTTSAAGGAASQIGLGGTYGAGTASGEEGYYGTILMWNPSAAAPCMFTYDLGYRESNGGTAMRLTGTGFRVAAANVDGIRFLWNTGNFASGTINLYGRRK